MGRSGASHLGCSLPGATPTIRDPPATHPAHMSTHAVHTPRPWPRAAAPPPRPAGGALARRHEAKAVDRAQCRRSRYLAPTPISTTQSRAGHLRQPPGSGGVLWPATRPPRPGLCRPRIGFVTKCAPIPARAPHLSVAADGATSRLTGRSWYRWNALGQQDPMRTTPPPAASFLPAPLRVCKLLSSII